MMEGLAIQLCLGSLQGAGGKQNWDQDFAFLKGQTATLGRMQLR